MSEEEVIPIPKSFTNRFPDLSEDKANKYWKRYLRVIAKHTMKPYLTLSSKRISFPYKKARDDCSSFRYYGARKSIWSEFGEGAGFIQLITKGSNLTKKNSEIIIKDTRHLQHALDVQDKEEIYNLFYSDCDDNTECDVVSIDHSSLMHYIRSTEHELTKNISNALKDTLEKNLTKAKTIKLISEYYFSKNSNYALPQRISESSYGRRYYKGINLQNCHKLLRKACLGKSYEYDLRTAAYVIKLIVAKNILEKHSDYELEEFFPYTKQYIENKQLVRDTLAKYITSYREPQVLVKQVLTAVGFGATANSPSWSGSAIASIVRNKDERIELLKDEWLVEFISEQKQLTTFITDYYLMDRDFVASIKGVEKIKNKNGKYVPKQVMSYIFQTLEYLIMNEICEHIPQESLLLRVHDAVYTKHPIKAERMRDIKEILAKYSPLLVLEHDNEKDVSTRYKFTKEADDEEAQHRHFIKQEEQLAKEHFNRYQ